MSFSTVLSAAVDGLAVEFVHVETDVSNGLPVFHMVGYLSSEVKEAGERVRTAVKNTGLDFPPRRMVVNLSPATVRKRGASFDLPIAVSVLMALGEIDPLRAEGCLIIGELGLDGSVRKVPGVLPVVMEAKKRGILCFIVPGDNAAEGALVDGVSIIGVRTLTEVVGCLRDTAPLEAIAGRQREEKERRGRKAESGSQEADNQSPAPDGQGAEADFSQVRGQENVRRAAEIAVSGGHNLLLIGPPGSGKSLTARCIAGILPPLTMEESMEITKIYSVMGMLDEEQPLIRHRPFREVHHTATRAAMIGGGMVPRPGEISLASGGILFLDELAEFRKSVLEVLRQPLENREIQISRTYGKYTFPADFILVAAMNPCPCGCYPDLDRCTCTPFQIQNYLSRISQPFLDRIDLCAEAAKVKYGDLTGGKPSESSAEIRRRVCAAREVQKERYRGSRIRTNAMLRGAMLEKYCELGEKEKRVMEQAYEVLGLTARAYHRILRTARTIADMDGEEKIREEHLCEAVGYRTVDRKYWGGRL